ncbi:MAG TPA: M6 family metalloprotease domain-containing protein [Gemmatimonadales bacterium]|nr:M6 family metalloprotease domain-containing protein [Gemmatimonadales bacterium]
MLIPLPVQAQYPRAVRGQFEVHGLDFRREGAWRKRVAAIRTARHRLLRHGALAPLNLTAPTAAGGVKVTGRVMVPVIPIAFANAPPPYPVSRYEEVFFSSSPTNGPYSLKTFYEQLSNGNISVEGRVFPWVTADSNDAYYEDGCNGIGVLGPCPARQVSRFGQLLLRTLDLVSLGVTGSSTWSDFDNDGPDGRPNSGDDDGFVDFVTFLQSRVDGACPHSPHIWAHRFVIRAWNGGSPYVTRTPWTGHPGQFLKIDDYIMQSALGGTTSCDGSAIMPIGTVAHETGHAFGLPDLYDTDLSNPEVTQGIGEWGLMGSGNYARPYSPARYEAWSLFELGWVAVDTLRSGRDVHLNPVASSDTVLYLPVSGTDEFFLLENRQAQESDSAQMNAAFGPRQKSPGLLVWHIDQGQVDEHGFDADNRVNVGPIHGVALIQADGRNDLREPGGGNRGDSGDSFPGSSDNRTLCRTTHPAVRDNQGHFARFCLDGITQVAPGGGVSFRFISYHSVFAADRAGAVISVNRTPVSRLEQFFTPGTLIELSADSTQVDQSGRTRFDFLAWSNGGARTHNITAGEEPDTVIAQFGVAHRIRTTVQGATPAAIVTALTGNISEGVYVSEGSQVALRAAPQPNAVFLGWSGDTTASADTLLLLMQRPFDLVANFVEVQQVGLDNAAAALLGTGALRPEEATYLDALGNRNGEYDLGDFLAANERSASDPGASALVSARGAQ